MTKKTIWMCVCLIVFANIAKAQIALEFYVDGSKAVNGNGTLANPWNRIFYAINSRVIDTTKDAIVYIKRGRYTIDPNINDTKLYIGKLNGGRNGKYLVLRTYVGDEGKVIIDGKNLTTNPFFPSMFVIDSAKFVRIQNLSFRNLKGTSGFGIYTNQVQSVEIRNCSFDSMQWTNTVAEQGYPVVNNVSNYLHPIYLQNSTGVTVANDTLRNSALGYGEFVRFAGNTSAITQTANIASNNTAVANNYYVALTGNDTTGSGSITKPWRSASKAINSAGIDYSVVPAKLIGQDITVFMRAGTYQPSQSIVIGATRGTNNKWFTLKNYGTEVVVFNGANLYTIKYSALLSISDAKNIRVEGLRFTNMTNDSTKTNQAPAIGSRDTKFGIIVSGNAKNIVIKKNYIYDMAWTRVAAKQKIPSPFDNLSPLLIIGTRDTSLRNVVIDSNFVYNNVMGYSEAVTVNGNVDSFSITKNQVYDNANIGIVAAGNYNWIVADPNFSVTAPNNFSKNGFIRGNTTYRNISPIAVSAGIYLDGARNVVIENNNSYQNGTGISVGSEQNNSISGYHLVQNNVVSDNITAGMVLGSTNSTCWVENCVIKNNTIRDNYIIDPVLRAKANNSYGIDSASQRYTEVNINRLRNSTYELNTIEPLSNFGLGFYYVQSGLTLRNNTYFNFAGSACVATFVKDMNNDGGIGLPTIDSIYTTFHKYVTSTGYDLTSICEGETYNPNGCLGPVPVNNLGDLVMEETTTNPLQFAVYPNPVVHDLTARFNMEMTGLAEAVLMDLSGRVLVKEQYQLAKGMHQIQIKNLKQKGIKPGIYFLNVLTSNGKKSAKIMVQ
jgi:Right handed beta helix region/Secretion system C-terminal sorting domain